MRYLPGVYCWEEKSMMLPEAVETAINDVADQLDEVATSAGELLEEKVYDSIDELSYDEQLDIVFRVYDENQDAHLEAMEYVERARTVIADPKKFLFELAAYSACAFYVRK